MTAAMDEEREAAQPGTPAATASMLCAIHVQEQVASAVPAVTYVNGTALCAAHARHAPRSALPYGDVS